MPNYWGKYTLSNLDLLFQEHYQNSESFLQEYRNLVQNGFHIIVELGKYYHGEVEYSKVLTDKEYFYLAELQEFLDKGADVGVVLRDDSGYVTNDFTRLMFITRAVCMVADELIDMRDSGGDLYKMYEAIRLKYLDRKYTSKEVNAKIINMELGISTKDFNELLHEGCEELDRRLWPLKKTLDNKTRLTLQLSLCKMIKEHEKEFWDAILNAAHRLPELLELQEVFDTSPKNKMSKENT